MSAAERLEVVVRLTVEGPLTVAELSRTVERYSSPDGLPGVDLLAGELRARGCKVSGLYAVHMPRGAAEAAPVPELAEAEPGQRMRILELEGRADSYLDSLQSLNRRVALLEGGTPADDRLSAVEAAVRGLHRRVGLLEAAANGGAP